MFKKIFVILFIFICTINIFAQSHDIHNQITKINVEIEILKKNIEKQDIQKNIKNLEKQVQKLNLEDKNINVTIKNDLKPLLSELVELNKVQSEKEKLWTPSDFGTITIAILTFLIVLFNRRSVNLLKKQNREQKVTNKETIDLLKKEQDLHHNSIILNHFTNQINNLIFSLEAIDKELDIFMGQYIDLSNINNKKYEVKMFCFKFESLIIMINKALPYGYNLELLRINLGRYAPIAKILYNNKKINEGTYLNYKIMLASSVHIGRDINIDLKSKFVEELKIELGDFIKEDILTIEYFHNKTIDDLKIKFEVKLKNGNLYQRDEKGNWTF